jgi:hypothetical protein
MYRMTSFITVEGFKDIIKPTEIKWKKSITDYSDTATIKLPAIAMLKKEDGGYERVETGLKFDEGLQITIFCGYDGVNYLRFKGFIRQIKPNNPLEIECEGYSYKIRKIKAFNKSYRAGTNIKKILTDLIKAIPLAKNEEIPIKLSDDAHYGNIESPVNFSGKTGVEVLDWFKEKMFMTVYFNSADLYVGLRFTNYKNTIKLRLGWNVVDDNELKYNPQKSLTKTNVSMSAKQKDGSTKYADPKSKEKGGKQIKMDVRVDSETLKKIQEDQQQIQSSRGYEGTLTAFLVPFAEPAMAVEIEDTKYPARSGKYFIEAVEGEYSAKGGRQKIKISASL